MPSKRSKLEIYIDILSKIRSGECRPTRIMYQTNLSWKPFRQILESLENQGMIEVMDPEDQRSRILYKITEKGDYVLRYFDKGKSLLEVVATSPLARATTFIPVLVPIDTHMMIQARGGLGKAVFSRGRAPHPHPSGKNHSNARFANFI